jgi:DNA-binding NtrC family response regulator
MSKPGPIIIIDDDPDDQEMIHRILSRISPEMELKKFYDGEDALAYFLSTKDKPFMVLCDINMPLMNGLELRKKMESNTMLKQKMMPFIYLTTTASPDQVLKAHHLAVQGFFVKGQSYDELRDTLTDIMAYWKRCERPISNL